MTTTCHSKELMRYADLSIDLIKMEYCVTAKRGLNFRTKVIFGSRWQMVKDAVTKWLDYVFERRCQRCSYKFNPSIGAEHRWDDRQYGFVCGECRDERLRAWHEDRDWV